MNQPSNAQQQLTWNLGGWLGGQIGGTAWMLVAAILAGIRDPATGLLLFALFAIPNVVGIAMWRRRRLTCYGSSQVLFAVVAVCSLFSVYALDRANAWERIQTGGSISSQSAYWIILAVFAGLMLMFYFRFGRNGGAGTN